MLDYVPDPKSPRRVFRVDVAENISIPAALVLETIVMGVEDALNGDQNYIEGRTWYYHSLTKLTKYHPYISKRTLQRALNDLIDHGILLKGNFNKWTMDRTLWYALKNEEEFFPTDKLKERKAPCGQNEPPQNCQEKDPAIWTKCPHLNVPNWPHLKWPKCANNTNIDIDKEKNKGIGEASPSQPPTEEETMGTLEDNLKLMEKKQAQEKLRQSKKAMSPTKLNQLIHLARVAHVPEVTGLMPVPKVKDLGMCKSLLRHTPDIAEHLDLLGGKWSSFLSFVNSAEGTEYQSSGLNLKLLLACSAYIKPFVAAQEVKATQTKVVAPKAAEKEPQEDKELITNEDYYQLVLVTPPEQRTPEQVQFMLGYIDAEPGTESLAFEGYDFYAS